MKTVRVFGGYRLGGQHIGTKTTNRQTWRRERCGGGFQEASSTDDQPGNPRYARGEREARETPRKVRYRLICTHTSDILPI